MKDIKDLERIQRELLKRGYPNDMLLDMKIHHIEWLAKREGIRV